VLTDPLNAAGARRLTFSVAGDVSGDLAATDHPWPGPRTVEEGWGSPPRRLRLTDAQ